MSGRGYVWFMANEFMANENSSPQNVLKGGRAMTTHGVLRSIQIMIACAVVTSAAAEKLPAEMLYASDRYFGNLLTIDPGTGAATIVGPDGAAAVEIVGLTFGPDQASAIIPEPTSLALLAVGGLGLGLGVPVRRRRRIRRRAG